MLRTLNGSQWDYPNQTIVVVTQPAQGQLAQASNAEVGNGLSGLIGLATNKNVPPTDSSSVYQAQFADSIYGQVLERNPARTNFTFGMQLGRPLNIPRGNASTNNVLSTTPGDPGTLHWLQPDDSAYDQSKLQWMDAGPPQGSAPFANSTGDWYVSLDGWVLVSGNNHVSNSKSVVATVDPLYTEMYLPQDQARLIHDAIPGSNLRPDLSTLGSLSEAWTIPCNASFSYGIVVGTQTFTVDQHTLVLQQPDGSCVSGIEGWTDDTQTQYVFGARFLSTVYLIFNVPRNGGNTIGIAPRADTQKSSSHVGAIVGGVVGGVAAVVIGACAVWFFVYRHRSRAHRITAAQYDAGHEIEKMQDARVHPFPLGAATPTTVQFAHAPESSVGSDALSALPSPHGATYGRSADDDMGGDIAPPSYETSEADRRASQPTSQVSLPLPSARSEKAQLATRYAADGPSAMRSGGYTPSPLSPTFPDEAGASGSGSATMNE